MQVMKGFWFMFTPKLFFGFRGIDVVRERIKQFASRKVTLPSGRHKIVILDEADSMTEGAQQVNYFKMKNFYCNEEPIK